jgi:hypothetical protein
VRTQRRHLKPGLYVVCGTRTWRHYRQRLPSHARTTKGGADRPGLRAKAGARQSARDMLRRLTPPWFLYVRRGQPGRFTVAIAAMDGAVVLLSPGPNGEVARQIEPSGLDANYVELRRRLADHVELPEFALTDDGGWLLEEFVDGSYLFDLPLGQQLTVVKKLFASYISLAHHEREDGTAEFFGQVKERIAECQLPSDLLSAAAPILDSSELPLVPSRPGGSVMNLVVAAELRPVQIDLPAVTLAPFFYDPIALVLAAEGPILDRFSMGHFDPELRALFAAADLNPPGPDCRKALLAAACIVRAHLRNAPGPLADPSSFEHAVLTRWRRVAALSWDG